MASSGPGAVLSSFIPSGCSGSAAKVPVRGPPPPAITCVGDPGHPQRVRRAHKNRIRRRQEDPDCVLNKMLLLGRAA